MGREFPMLAIDSIFSFCLFKDDLVALLLPDDVTPLLPMGSTLLTCELIFLWAAAFLVADVFTYGLNFVIAVEPPPFWSVLDVDLKLLALADIPDLYYSKNLCVLTLTFLVTLRHCLVWEALH